MNKLITLLALSFFGFILWVIYLANTGQSSVFFQLIGQLPYGDKIGHLLLFGLLTLVANFALRLATVKLGVLNVYWGALLVSLFVVIEESSQYFIPQRTFDAGDLLADGCGILLFCLLTKSLSNTRLGIKLFNVAN